jgi:hypothetical protein
MHDKTPGAGVPVESASNATFSIERTAGIFFVAVPFVLWIWLCRDWPARLGFYSDDWMVLLHPFVGTTAAFRDTLYLVATRPVSAPYIWLAQVIVDWSPVRSQLLNAAMLLVTAAGIGLLAAALISVVRGLRAGAWVGASAAAASFIVFPSIVGTFAWGTGVSTVVPALPLFCLAVAVLLHSGDSWFRLGAGLVLAMLSHLAYEAFWFQEIPLVLIAATLRGNSTRDIPWRVLVGAVIVNVACVALNRLVPGGTHKAFAPDFLRVFDAGYSHFLAILGHAVREHEFLVGFAVVGAMLGGSTLLTGIIKPAKALVSLLLMIGAIVASGFLYAFAGYPLHAEGPPARVFIVVATYYSVAAGVLSAAAWCSLDKRRLSAAMFFCCATVGLIALSLTARFRVGEWADTWSYELARLARLPVSMATVGNGERIYVAIEDKAASTIEPATASYEISGAVAWAFYKATNSRMLALDRWRATRTVPQWVATPPEWFNRWNGRSFEQGPCGGAVSYSVAGSELWAWKTSAGTVSKIDAPWEHRCQ